MAVALLNAGAKIDFATPASINDYPGYTPLMYAADGNRAGLVKMLHKCGADGTMTTTRAAFDIHAGSTALDIARSLAARDPGFTDTFAALRKRCCSSAASCPPAWPPRERASSSAPDVPQVVLAHTTAMSSASALTGCRGTARSASRRGGRSRLLAPGYEPGKRWNVRLTIRTAACDPTCPTSTNVSLLML